LLIDRKPSSRENQLNNSNAFRRVEPVKSDRLLGSPSRAVLHIRPDFEKSSVRPQARTGFLA